MSARGASGVTLIELLVAVAIFGIFSVMAYGGLTRLLDSRERLTEEQRFWQSLSLAFVRLSDDLSHARARSVRDEGGVSLPALAGRPTDIRALAAPSLELTRGGELRFGEGAHSDLRRVAYRLREGRLERLTWPVLDRGPVTKPLESVMLEHVETFSLKFHGDRPGTGESWPASGAADLTELPRAVEVVLTLTGRGEYKRLFLVNR